MLIANPIYDVIFKRLMENERIAKFFISTIIDQPILKLEVKSREFTYRSQNESIRLFRLDFLALVQTTEGPKKVLVEVQKSRKPLQADLLRFRRYLGEQYSKTDEIEGQEEILSIITIYILGFNLADIKTPYLRLRRCYEDGLTGALVKGRHKFVDCLTHDSHFIQAKRVGGKVSTRLEGLLSIFEQRHFEGNETVKRYEHNVGSDSDLQSVLDDLGLACSDVKVRKDLALELEAWSAMDEVINDSMAKDRVIAESKRALSEKEKVIAASKQALSEKDKVLSEKDKLIAELQRKLNSKT